MGFPGNLFDAGEKIIGGTVGSVVNGATHAVSGLADATGINKLIGTGLGGLVKDIGGGLSTIEGGIGKLIGGTGDAVKSVGGGVGKAAASIGTATGSAVQGFGQAGSRLVGSGAGLIDSIGSVLPMLVIGVAGIAAIFLLTNRGVGNNAIAAGRDIARARAGGGF